MAPGSTGSLLDRLEKASTCLLGPLARQAAPAVVGRDHSEQLEDLGSAAKAMGSFCQAFKLRDSWAEHSWADGRLRSVLLQLLAAPAMRMAPASREAQGDAAECVRAFRLQLLRLCSVLLHADANVLDPAGAAPESTRLSGGGGSTSSIIRSGGQRPGAAGATAACVPSRASLQLQALRFGDAVLRMGALPCCCGQLAAACARVQSEHGAEMQGRGAQHDQQQQQPHGGRHVAGRDRERGRGCSGSAQEPAPLQDEVCAVLGLTEGLVALAQAALGVLGAEGPAVGAAAAAGADGVANRERRQLCRRLVLQLAAGLRHSRMLDHCARAALLATISMAGEGGDAGGSGGGDGVISLFQALNRVLAGVSHLLVAQQDHSALASNTVGPTLSRALAGPGVSHYILATGLRCLCAADGGPGYGMPASYSALPVEWYGGRHSSYGLPAAGPSNLLDMMRLLTRTDRGEQLLGGAGPPIVLLLRACDLAVLSAAAHRAEVRVGRSEVRRCELQGVLLVDGLLPVALDALMGLNQLLKRGREQLQCSTSAGEGGGVGVAATAGAGQGGSELGSGGNAGEVGPRHRKPAEGQPLHSVPGMGEGNEPLGAAEGTDVESAAGAASGSMCGTLERPSAGHERQEAGGPPPPEPVQPRPRPLTRAQVYRYDVHRWNRVYVTVVDVLPLLLDSGRDGSPSLVGADMRRSLAEWLAMEDVGLPDPMSGPLPASPPPVLAAALEAGLLSCLQHVVWWAERDLAGRSFLSDIAARWARGRLLGGGGFWPLAYGDVAQSLELLSALARVLPQGAAQPGAAEAGCDCTCVLLVTIKPLLDFSYGFLANSYPRVWRSGSPSSSSPPAPPSGGSGPPLAAAPPPPGLPRLELVAAHAARLLLPRLSRLMCGLAGTAQQGRGGTAASGRLIRHCEGVSGCVLVWVEALTTLCAPGGSTSSSGAGGGGTGGSGTGRCTGRGVSSSSGSSMGGGMGASGSTGGGSTPHGSPTQLQVTLLRRFLLEEVRVLELLGAMLRSLPAVKATPQASMYASALTTAAAAFASELAHAMMEAGRCGGAGFAGGGSGAGAGAGRARSRANGSTGPGPSPGHRPHPVWPPDLVRSLGRQLEQEGSACHGTPLKQLENMLRANLLLGSLAPQPGGIGGSHGGGGQHVLQLPPAWSPSMVRTLYEVLGAEAGDPA